MVADENFGCGSSREHAPVAIKAAGVSCVIAKSFARIFYRNSINMGLPILECPEACDAISDGDVVSIDADTGTITDETTGVVFHAQPFPPFRRSSTRAASSPAPRRSSPRRTTRRWRSATRLRAGRRHLIGAAT